MKHLVSASLLMAVAGCTQTEPVSSRDEELLLRMGDAASPDYVLHRAFEKLELSYLAHSIGYNVNDYGLVEGMDPATNTQRIRAQAEKGSADAQNNLGFAYLRGDGLPQDYSQARSWFENAANGGSTQAMHNLADMYRRGSGVPEDLEMAAQWIRKGAELGEPSEQMHICLIYALGKGVRQDFVLAYAWCNLGSSRNPRDSRLDDVETRAEVAKFLSPSQLAEGQGLSSGWKEGESIGRETENPSPGR